MDQLITYLHHQKTIVSITSVVDKIIMNATRGLGLTCSIDEWKRYKISDWDIAFIRVDYNPELDWLSIRFSDRWKHTNISYYIDELTIHSQEETIAMFLKEELEKMIERHKAYNQISRMIQEMKEMVNTHDIPIHNMFRTIYGELETSPLSTTD